MNLYGFAAGDPVNFSDPFGLCPDSADPACEKNGAVATLSITGSAGFGLIAAHFQVGVAINSSGSMMGFARGGPSTGAGVSAGLELGVERGSLNGLLAPVDDNGNGISVTVAPGVPRPSVTVSKSGAAVGARGGVGAFVNISNGGVATGTTNVPAAVRGNFNAMKTQASEFVRQGVQALICAGSPCSR